MGTSSSALTSFNGTSKFASSLQQVLTRAVGLASLPLDSLAATQTKLNDRQSALQTLDAHFIGLQGALNTIDHTVSTGVLNSSVSDGSIVSTSLQSGATAGVYSIEVTSLGSFSSALSVAGATPVTDPTTQGLTSSTTFSLSAGGVTTAITAGSSSLQDLASAINLQAGAQAQASIVNVGSSGSPDYRLSIRATRLGTSPITLVDGASTDLVSSSTAGALASFTVDGSGSVTSDSRSITLAPGVTVNLLGQSAAGVPATVTVRNDASSLASAFSNFAQSYNSTLDAIGKSRGTSGGALQGDNLLASFTGILSKLGNYTSGTPETALASFGISVDKAGHLSVDSTVLTAKANANFPSFLSVVGSATSGGFLKTATDLLESVENTNSGSLKSSESSVTAQLTNLQNKISDQQIRVTQLQQNLIQQLAKADTAIAKLESQVSYVNGLFFAITGNNNGTNNPNAL